MGASPHDPSPASPMQDQRGPLIVIGVLCVGILVCAGFLWPVVEPVLWSEDDLGGTATGHYTYHVRIGQWWKAGIDGEYYLCGPKGAAEDRDPVEVRYDPDDPERCRATRWIGRFGPSERTLGGILGSLIVLQLIGLVIAVVVYIRRRRATTDLIVPGAPPGPR